MAGEHRVRGGERAATVAIVAVPLLVGQLLVAFLITLCGTGGVGESTIGPGIPLTAVAQ